ncbi:retrovirus-related pol polyprotein from transposon TNT 1-94 [Tanacetum coccineum]|uniref:Retrovirus-related pol polyprotein from transposon TNT 1-94 n=1 Tax=Tanacetum coccineum TaxID=301880 RepID=A0ABQ5JFL7_9ASTR
MKSQPPLGNSDPQSSTVTVEDEVVAKDEGGPVVQQSGIQCFNCKEFGHYAKECRKPKRVRDSTYHKEKMLLCKQAEKGVQLQAEQSDWLADTDEEIDEQELEAHYSYMAKIQEVPNADSGTDAEPLEQVHYDTDHNVFANDLQHFEQSESISNTCAVETGDSNVIPDSPDMCDNDIQNDQHDVDCDDERVALANLIANLKLDVDDNKKIQKQLKKANATLTQELTECKSILAETSRTLGESNSIRDSCLVALQNKQTEFEKYKAFNDRTVDYDKLERKLNETLGLLAQKDIDIQEGLKVKAYEISVVQAKHDELVKQSLLTRSHYEGLVKEKTKVITDLKLREDKDIDKMISMEHQIKFLNEIVYKRGQSIQTIQMLAPKCSTFNGRPTFANPMYHKKAQSGPATRLIPDSEEILTLADESRSKLNKDLVKPFDYTKLNSLYEIFKPPTQHYEIQFAQANEIRKKMWRKSFVKTKPNVFKNIDFLPVSKSDDSLAFIHELKKEMHADLKYVESLEDELDELESDKAEFSNMYDMLLQDFCVRMYRIAVGTTQTRAPQLNQTFRNTNPRASTSTGIAHKTNVSRPPPRSNQMKDKVVPYTSHAKLKKTEVEEHPRISSISNKTKSVTACNDSLNSRTSNANAVCATCGKCVFNSNHDACVSKYLNDVNARTKKPNVVPISTRKPKRQANKSVATPHKKTVACSKSYYRMLYQKTSKAWKWWIAQQCPSSYTWVPKTQKKWVPRTQKKWVPKTQKQWVPKVRNESVPKRVSFAVDNTSRITNIVQLILFIVDSGCTKHMTGNVSLLCNFVDKYLGTVRFGNDQFAPILGYGDLIQGNITIKRVYYVEGLNHNLFSVGQFCDADLEVAFRKSTCFVRDLQGNDLLTGNRGSDLYTISLQDTTSSTPICLMAKASPTQAWLWHRRLSHLNFDYINLLSKKDIVIGLPTEICQGSTMFFFSKDETPEVLKDFLKMIQQNLQAPVIFVLTDRGTEFLNKTLNAFFKEEGVKHQTSTPRTPKQNIIVKRRNRTLFEAARTMLLASKTSFVLLG